MARVNVFVEAGNEHRTESLGGRAANNNGWASINTDTETGSSKIKIQAGVFGNTDLRSRRKNGDNRRVIFHVTLPEPNPSATTYIRGVSVRVSDEVLEGESLKDTFERFKDDIVCSNVELFDGISLKEAIAAVLAIRAHS